MSAEDPHKNLSEEQVISLLTRISRKRDRRAMAAFYLAYKCRLGGFLFRIAKNQQIVEEIYNDVMLVVWHKAQQFDGSSKVSTWVFGIGYRTALKRLNRESKHKVVSDDAAIQEKVETNESLANDQQEVVAKVLDTLSIEHRTVIELAYFVGNNYAEIADITNIPENTVKTRIYYARKSLQLALKDLGVTSVVSN